MDKLLTLLKGIHDKNRIQYKNEVIGDSISTGYEVLDQAIVYGGLPKGKITEIFGAPGVGKTSVSYHVIKKAQDDNYICCYIDVENAFDKQYAKKLGIKLQELMIIQPKNGEILYLDIQKMVNAKCIDLIVIDSLPALTFAKEIPMLDDEQVRYQHMSGFIMGLITLIENSNTVLLILNQVRAMGRRPSKKIMNHYANLIIELKKIKSLKKDDILIGYQLEANIIKGLKTENPIFELYR